MPGETLAGAWLDLARTVVRRAERDALRRGRAAVARRCLSQPAVRPAVDHGPLAGEPFRAVPAVPIHRQPRGAAAMTPSSGLAIEVGAGAPRDVDVIGVPVAATGPVPRQLGLSRARLTELGFEAKPGQTLAVASPSGPSLVAVGLGAPADIGAGVLRSAAAALARAAGTRGSLATSLADVDARGLTPGAAGQAVAEGFVLGTYRFSSFKSEAPKPGLSRVVLTAAAGDRAAIATGAARRRGRRRSGRPRPRPRQHAARPPQCRRPGRAGYRHRRRAQVGHRGARRVGHGGDGPRRDAGREPADRPLRRA